MLSDDKIDSYLDNRSITNNEFSIDIEPDLLLDCQFSLPHRCWFPLGDDDSNPVINQTGISELINNEKSIVI